MFGAAKEEKEMTCLLYENTVSFTEKNKFDNIDRSKI